MLFGVGAGFGRMRTKRLFSILALAALGTGVLVLSGFVALAYYIFPRETNRLDKYAELLANWDGRLVGQFPAEIPADAVLARFSNFPGFMQGGGHIQLRLQLRADRIGQLHLGMAERKTKSFFGGHTSQHMNAKEGMPTTFFHTGDFSDLSFPDDYEIMIFDKLLPESERSSGFYWNHGQSHGVAISPMRSEIVYWAEAW